jgi:hypothetical protein
MFIGKYYILTGGQKAHTVFIFGVKQAFGKMVRVCE